MINKHMYLLLALVVSFGSLHSQAPKSKKSSYVVRKSQQLKDFLYDQREEIVAVTVGAIALYAYTSYVFGSSKSFVGLDSYHGSENAHSHDHSNTKAHHHHHHGHGCSAGCNGHHHNQSFSFRL